MRKIKYLGLCVVLLFTMFIVTGCGNKSVEGKLEDIMSKLYADIAEDHRPSGLTNMEINDENLMQELDILNKLT